MGEKKRSQKKGTRGARGLGTVFESRGRYVARKPIGTRNGRTLYLERTGATQAEALRKLALASPPTPTMTLSAWLDRWLPTLDHMKAQSRDDYEIAVRLRIKPALGHMPLTGITTFDVERAVREWGLHVGAATVRKTCAVLSACLQAANRADAVPRNAARPARKPSAPASSIDPFTPAELRAIVAAGTRNPEYRALGACAATGCRIGEALALARDSYDVKTGRLTISGTKTRSHGIGTPKSARSARVIVVLQHARKLFAAGVPRVSYVVAYRRWPRLLAELKLRPRNLHQVRHSWASHMAAKKVPIADLAAYLGDSVEVLVRTYVHPTGYPVHEAMERLFDGK